jgi:hypothetical protein
VRYFHPPQDVAESPSVAGWAAALKSGSAEEPPGWVTGKWGKVRQESEMNEVLDCIGPEIKVSLSEKGNKLRILKEGKETLAAAALQLLGTNHPLF